MVKFSSAKREGSFHFPQANPGSEEAGTHLAEKAILDGMILDEIFK